MTKNDDDEEGSPSSTFSPTFILSRPTKFLCTVDESVFSLYASVHTCILNGEHCDWLGLTAYLC